MSSAEGLSARKAITGGEWIISARLEVDGYARGAPIEMRYVDSVLAPCPENVVRLICGRLQAHGLSVAPAANADRKRRS